MEEVDHINIVKVVDLTDMKVVNLADINKGSDKDYLKTFGEVTRKMGDLGMTVSIKLLNQVNQDLCIVSFVGIILSFRGFAYNFEHYLVHSLIDIGVIIVITTVLDTQDFDKFD